MNENEWWDYHVVMPVNGQLESLLVSARVTGPSVVIETVRVHDRQTGAYIPRRLSEVNARELREALIRIEAERRMVGRPNSRLQVDGHGDVHEVPAPTGKTARFLAWLGL